MLLNEIFWDNKYKSEQTGWDIGSISTPLKEYFDQLTNKELKILIPGGGNSYEAEYLHKKGFKNVYVVDISATVLTNFQKRVPSFPNQCLINIDFFELNDSFDLIIEQTFFCAINPDLRPKYASKMSELLLTNGKLVGLFFNIPLFENNPPFGGTKKEYIPYFKPYFKLDIIEDSYNSILERRANELFIKFIKK
ncbi:MAG: methyltransferase domain-containing protein [Flavobacteriaceae bacterium]|jgi:thiopurine S-methyltransferase|nr:methyltransferase domain-containing protein [Flavobacteriaceae bacterium]MBT3920319.1 methyltransferase domain-containing protein [Flavobacteriaceae bacterium]MBT6705979.1 methyltransferase domain-containing protein [Flavobacteriaceae bacterium]MBT7242810.1 methyltransferase domain-containing protein [Flavobacteriaceae bacterium]|tara:strand:+ start:54 stop:635 length:582 start_codon:yes stop_codon:yes gene_type:complete